MNMTLFNLAFLLRAKKMYVYIGLALALLEWSDQKYIMISIGCGEPDPV